MKKNLVTFIVAAMTAVVMSACIDGIPANPFLQLPKYEDEPVSVVRKQIHAATPLITAHPQDAVYSHGAAAVALTVSASADDGGTLSYRWYRDDLVIPNATGASYTPPTDTLGTLYYYVEVTNTIKNNGDGGNKTATVRSNTAEITVNDKVNAAYPVISQPVGAAYFRGDTATALIISASISDNGVLSYQWYGNETDSNEEGTAIDGATGTSYTPPTDTASTVYYYVLVTNTIADNGDGGNKTATERSNTAKIEVIEKVHAAIPVISSHPQDAVYRYNGTATALTVSASVSDDGTLSYRWYRNDLVIPGETGISYTPPTGTAGTVYYYVDVTNTIANNGDGGNKTATIRSNTAAITVNQKVNASISISSQPQDAVYSYHGTAIALTVSAEADDGGILSYQWYRNDENSNEGGTAIDGATEADYTPPTEDEGIVYYYVVVTNTIVDNGDGGNKTAAARSDTARIEVNEEENAAVPLLSQLSGITYTYGDTATKTLTISAQVSDNGALSYQWYRNTTNSNTGGTAISGARGTVYTPPVGNAGMAYYYVVITNTIDDNGDGGNKSATVHSNTAAITVNRKPVTLTVTVSNKVYDRTTTATVTGTTITGNLDGANLTATGTATFANANVGNNNVTFSGWTLGGSSAGNYTLSEQPASRTANITAKPVTLTVYLSSKYYDRTTAANVANVTINGKIDGDSLTAVAGTATFENENAGNNKTITFSGWTLGGTSAGNYTLSQPANMTANINPRPVTITITVVSRTYDGTTTVPITGATINGKIDGDVLETSGSVRFADANAGTNKTVTGYNWTLLGSAAPNYTLSAQPTATATITAKGITLMVSVSNKEYDGNTTATANGWSLNGNIDWENLTPVAGTARFANANVGTGKTVTFSGWTLGGSAAGNYNLSSQPASTIANITAKPLTLSLSGELSPIDTTATVTVNGLVGSDTATTSITTTLPTGLTRSGNTITYNGTTAFANPTVTLNFTASAGSNYTIPSSGTTTLYVYDGQANYTGSGNDRRIPVTQANITRFNTYARTTNGLLRHYKLTQNVTLTGTNNWTAIGTNTARFTGSFNGEGYTITGLNINRTTEDYQGMFGVIGTGGIVQKLGLVGGSISGYGYVGGVAGANYGMIQDCYTTGSVTGDGNDLGDMGGIIGGNTGGVAGYNKGTIQNCYTTGSVSSYSRVGGVVGYNDGGTIQNCYATGNVDSSKRGGGFSNTGMVGGVVGINSGTVQNCYATGSISGGNSAGGVVGTNSGTVQNCYATGNVSGDYGVGGVVGYNGSNSSIRNCIALNTRVVSSFINISYIGRVVGYFYNSSSIHNNNYARNTGMTLRYDNTTTYTPTSNLTGKDGANTTAYNTQSFYTTAGNWYNNTAWNFTTVWQWNSTTSLPTLRSMPGNPAQNHTVQ